MIPQSTFLINAIIREGQKEKLRQLLASMNTVVGQADSHNTLVPFGSFDRLHMARFVILEDKTAEDVKFFGLSPYDWRPTLVFLGDFDGDKNSFLQELVHVAGPGLGKIFSFCEDFSVESISLLDWMKKNNVAPSANYINWIGRSLSQVREEAALHQSLAEYLHNNLEEVDRKNVRSLRQKLLSHVEVEKHAGRLTLTPPEPTPMGWRIRNLAHKIGIPLLLLLLSPLLLLVAPFYFWRLRMLERSEPEIIIRPDRERIQELSAQEDHDVSNQFNVFGQVKPGLFRLLTLKASLLLLNYSARHVYGRGYLTRVRTIHFARWVLMDDNRRIYFASNYDGSQESYMDDFINKVSWGLNLVFSNGVGYPSTRWLIKGGAEQEQKYKYTLRRHQLPSEVWYKAYPGLTAYDLSRNSRIRQGVENRQSSEADIRQWLSLI